MSPLTEDEKQRLLRLARQALEEGVRRHHLPEPGPEQGTLGEKRGAFVTLHKDGRLRGCIGYIDALKPLHQTVCECALAAALHDPRFDPVSAEELPAIQLEISVLSPLEEIAPENVEVGLHGLMVSRGARRGVLLPQVAMEWKWDRQRFLEETCMKAGLEPDAWRHGAKLQAFTAQLLAELTNPAAHSHHAV